ncbi:hypothetical protein TVAGG3_1006350 [Trichomonas vaginalis G3]|uniref:hypothetical protein n=1 Tax=Trichomonas vaginalis (strain ATCC PRA-98 / G3) TaxID=412133 RepID=UPI0021E5E490|nr:hypothetical protein TVAGG3_1006350 [Trichomonas vaginalis G3]KAI5491156.1 hypothetical protein TVAGG3_1006350 [Trichomonas vaginalis G3]
MNETAISPDFWKSAFLPVFKKLASSSLKQSIDNLRINEKLSDILSNNTIDSFNATKFSLDSQEDLKLRSLGLPPIITEFRSSLENTFLVLSSQLQSQITQIATVDMIRAPLNDVLSKCCKLLSISLSSASNGTSVPLTVYHLCGALASPSIVSILSENSSSSRSIKELTKIQENAAQLWASSIATKLADDYLSTNPGSSFSYLVSLEKKILEAAGHINTQVCAKNMRNEARKAVAEKLGQILENLTLQGGSEARSIAESKATNLFKDYCLFDIVLSMQNASVDLRPSFIEKMDPTKFHENEKKFVDEAKATLASSGELLKLMSGGKLIAPQSSNKVDINSKVNSLFSKRLKSQ